MGACVAIDNSAGVGNPVAIGDFEAFFDDVDVGAVLIGDTEEGDVGIVIDEALEGAVFVKVGFMVAVGNVFGMCADSGDWMYGVGASICTWPSANSFRYVAHEGWGVVAIPNLVGAVCEVVMEGWDGECACWGEDVEEGIHDRFCTAFDVAE